MNDFKSPAQVAEEKHQMMKKCPFFVGQTIVHPLYGEAKVDHIGKALGGKEMGMTVKFNAPLPLTMKKWLWISEEDFDKFTAK